MKMDEFNTLREISAKPDSSQRNLAKKLGFSLGKLNYCVTALKNKGLIKLSNFKKSENKAKYSYLLTRKGFSEKAKLTIAFMKRKMKEYDELRQELEKLKEK